MTTSQSYRSSAAQETQHSPANSTRDAGFLQTGPTEMRPFICLPFRLDQQLDQIRTEKELSDSKHTELTTIDPFLFLTVIAEMSDHGQP